jgi:mannitol/fructose-specific phosphotransferase system IIA component (Ntr-type)
MLLHELITRETQIVTDLRATDRWDAIDELMSVLIQCAGISQDKAAAVAVAVRGREESMSTGIGHGIGIPHAPTDQVDRVEAVLGIARHDIDFAALDGEPVHIVLLFVVPKNQFQEHLNTLANIARVLSDETTRQRLRDAATPADVLEVVRDGAKE